MRLPGAASCVQVSERGPPKRRGVGTVGRGSDTGPSSPRRRAPRRAVLQLLTTIIVGIALLVPWIAAADPRTLLGHSEDCVETSFELAVVEYDQDPALPAGGAITGEPLDGFSFLVSVDDVGRPTDPAPLKHPGLKALESTESAIVASGGAAPDANTATLSLCPGAYLITVERDGYTKWAEHVRVTATGAQGRFDAASSGVVTLALARHHPSPATIVAHVFQDHLPTNATPDLAELETRTNDDTGLAGFRFRIRERAGAIVDRDLWGNPICGQYAKQADGTLKLGGDDRPLYIDGTGGTCVTGKDGTVLIRNLPRSTYVVEAFAPEPGSSCVGISLRDGCHGETRWIRTGTFEGSLPFAPDSDAGSDVGGLTLVGPAEYWFGFVQATDAAGNAFRAVDATAGTGRITGCAKAWVGYPPSGGPVIDDREPLDHLWVALNDLGHLGDRVVVVEPLVSDPDCPGGRIDIRGVPEGDYRAFIWDESFAYVSRELTLDHVHPRGVVEVPSDDPRPSVASTGIFRRFGWLSGYVYRDDGVAANGRTIPRAAGNSVRDCLRPLLQTGLAADPRQCESPISGVRVRIRARDGSVTHATQSDSDGFYSFPRALAHLDKFEVLEVESDQHESTGPSLHDPYDWSIVTRLISDAGAQTRVSQLTAAGRRTWIDWGMRPYGARRAGHIAGGVYYDASRRALVPGAETRHDSEPGVPDLEVRLWIPVGGADTCIGPKTAAPGCDDMLAFVAAGTDHWAHPNRDAPDPNGPCDILDSMGNPVTWLPLSISGVGRKVGELCAESPALSNETKDGTFDGGYAFTRYCRKGFSETTGRCTGGAAPVPLDAGDYVVEVVVPEHWQIVREEDVNIFETRSAASRDASTACVGGLHIVDVADSRVDGYAPTGGAPASTPVDNVPFADPKVGGSPYEGRVRPLCDRRLVTLRDGDNAGADFFTFPLDHGARAGRPVPLPGRVFGRVTDARNVETDRKSMFFGTPRGVPDLPIGVRDSSFRLLTTVYSDESGFYEVLLPPTLAAECSTPEGGCPSEYVFVLNDPGPEEHGTSGMVRNAAGSNAVNGAGTTFSTEVKVGDRVKVGGEARVVTHVVSDTVLRVDPGWREVHARAALTVLAPIEGFDPRFRVERVNVDVAPGRTTLLETDVTPASGASCVSDTARPELYAVHHDTRIRNARPDSGPVFTSSQTRAVVILGRGFGESSKGAVVTLANAAGRTFAVPNASFDSGFGGDGWSDGEIRFTVPRSIPAGPYQLVVSVPKRQDAPDLGVQTALTMATGITLHLLGANYEPPVRFVDGLRGTDSADGRAPTADESHGPFRTIQKAVDATTVQRNGPAPLIVVEPATYTENVILHKRVKLQGYGPGGDRGTETKRDVSDDGESVVAGTVLSGKLFSFDPSARTAWSRKLRSVGANEPGLEWKVAEGANITVVADDRELMPPTTASSLGRAAGRAQIDGFGIEEGIGEGAGGVFVNRFARWLKISNNVFEGNQGLLAGALALGMPMRGTGGDMGSENSDITVSFNRFVGNGGDVAGAVAIFTGVDGYTFAHNELCANFSAGDGGGFVHAGRSTGTSKHPANTIAENVFSSNIATRSGGGLHLTGTVDWSRDRVEGSGPVDVLRNRFSSNGAGEDGGGLAVRSTLPGESGGCGPRHADGNCRDRIRVINSTFSTNTAARTGGGIALEDALNVQIVNSTVARNTSTGSCTACDSDHPGGAGLVSAPNSAEIQALLPTGAPAHSNPVLLNDIFFRNDAFTVDRSDLLDPPVINHGTVDLEITGGPGFLCAQFSAFTGPYVVSADACPGGLKGNVVLGENRDPFVRDVTTELDVAVGPLQRVVVDIVGGHAPQAKSTAGAPVPGDFHLCDSVIVRTADGGRCTSDFVVEGGAEEFVFARPWGPVTASAPDDDIDGGLRPVGGGRRLLGVQPKPDMGSDELDPRTPERLRWESGQRLRAHTKGRIRSSPQTPGNPVTGSTGHQPTGPDSLWAGLDPGTAISPEDEIGIEPTAADPNAANDSTDPSPPLKEPPPAAQ